ncbi:hypothetical protein GCM10027280_39640 [Micromonospora polyrhachis]|uniref:Uncharacterized protein n=1 Tax=Micromonospora polyrhachis TaxID=1282883 RepID=A0A7W7SU66_9ACTN|nr:hypothetical protein [Micromonospora polyrhachis]MBB4959820.1 hypothetical protein [Micromonospora polyrhachis]
MRRRQAALLDDDEEDDEDEDAEEPEPPVPVDAFSLVPDPLALPVPLLVAAAESALPVVDDPDLPELLLPPPVADSDPEDRESVR